MKLFTLLLLAFTLSAASWDGTKGNITTQTLGDSQHTAISVTDADSTVMLFSVVISYTPPCAPIGCTPLAKMAVQYAPHYVDKFGSGATLVVFDIPLGQINSVLISEFRAGQSQVFSTQ